MFNIEVPFFNPNSNPDVKICGVEYEVKKSKIKKICKNKADILEVLKHIETPCFHCIREKDAVGLLKILDKIGYKWRSGDSLTNSNWDSKSENGIYYYLTDNQKLLFANNIENVVNRSIIFQYEDDSLREFGINVYRTQTATVKVFANNIYEANDKVFEVDVDESSWQTVSQSNK